MRIRKVQKGRKESNYFLCIVVVKERKERMKVSEKRMAGEEERGGKKCTKRGDAVKGESE